MERRESSTEIDRAAADWALRLHEAPLGDTDQAELQAWLAADIRRRGAFARFNATLIQAGRAKALGHNFDGDGYIAAAGQGMLSNVEQPEPEPSAVAGLGRRKFLARAGGVGVAAAIAVVLGQSYWRPLSGLYATERGEVRSMPLSDGTRMTLNTATAVKVSMTPERRRIMLEHGEAVFDVAKDRARPFVVIAGDTEVEAVGTSFVVRRLPDRPTRIIVSEGVVEVRVREGGKLWSRRLEAGARADIDPVHGIDIATIDQNAFGRELAWRDGNLVFENQSLGEAAAEFARYSDRRIRFADNAIAEETITGLYPANDPLGFAHAVAQSLDLKAYPEARDIVLTRDAKKIPQSAAGTVSPAQQ